jgi:hypothetical protein
MMRFIKEQKGSALLLSLFISLILITLSFLVYSGITIYANYQACENELQQAAIISADMNMENANIRDLLLDIPPESAKSAMEENLIGSGWTLEDGKWTKRESGKAIYSFKNAELEIKDKTMHLSGVFLMPLPWAFGDISIVSIPMHIRASILYLDSERR